MHADEVRCKMQFPPSLEDVSLWLAVTAIILLVTAELISPQHTKKTIMVEKKRLKQTALIVGTLFLVTFAIQVYLTLI